MPKSDGVEETISSDGFEDVPELPEPDPLPPLELPEDEEDATHSPAEQV